MQRKMRAIVGAVASLAISSSPVLADEAADGLAAVQKGDYSAALDLFNAAGEHGNALIQAQLGSMYFDGIGVPVDHTKAIYWNSKAAASGRPDAAFRMGLAYNDHRNTYGVPLDLPQAQSWYAKAWSLAQPLLGKGDPAAEYAVGNELAFGFGQTRDREKGLVYLRRSADAGNLDAVFQVGELTVEKDEPGGKVLLLRAAEHGHSYAMYVLALVYLHNNDRDNAKIWLQRAVAYRNPNASQKLLDEFHIQTAVPGLGKLPEQVVKSNTYALSGNSTVSSPMALFTGVISLSIAIALLNNNSSGGGDQGSSYNNALDNQTGTVFKTTDCTAYMDYGSGTGVAHYPSYGCH